MKNELVRTTSTVGESNLHLQITPAYGRDIFVDKEVFELTKKYISEKSEKLGLIIPAMDLDLTMGMYSSATGRSIA